MKSNLYFDAQVLQYPQYRGVHVYAFNLLQQMARLDRDVNLHLHFGMSEWNTRIDELLTEPNIVAHRHPGSFGRHVVPWYNIIRTRSTAYCLLNGNTGRIPLGAPCRTAAVFHDLRMLYFPELYGAKTTKAFARESRRWMPKRDLIITGAETVKQEIISYFRIPQSRIVVVSEGCDHTANSTDGKTTYPLYDNLPYFLTVNPSDPRKNLRTILEAFKLYTQSSAAPHITNLLIAGVISNPEVVNEFVSKNPQLAQCVICLGYVGDDQLRSLFERAIASIYVSLYEGFGIPVVESIRHGCPTIISDIPVFREITDGKAYFVNPRDASSVASAMSMIDNDRQSAKQLVCEAQQVIARYSWKRSARIALDALLNL